MTGVPTGWAVVILLVVAVFGSAGAASLFTVKAVNRKTMAAAKLDEESADKADAEARKLISEAGVALLQPLMQQLAVAQTEVQALRTQIVDLTKEVTELRDENARLREENPWKP